MQKGNIVASVDTVCSFKLNKYICEALHSIPVLTFVSQRKAKSSFRLNKTAKYSLKSGSCSWYLERNARRHGKEHHKFFPDHRESVKTHPLCKYILISLLLLTSFPQRNVLRSLALLTFLGLCQIVTTPQSVLATPFPIRWYRNNLVNAAVAECSVHRVGRDVASWAYSCSHFTWLHAQRWQQSKKLGILADIAEWKVRCNQIMDTYRMAVVAQYCSLPRQGVRKGGLPGNYEWNSTEAW